MTEFEIVFVVFGIGACIVGVIQVTIAYRSTTRDIEPDPERVRRFVERGMELRQKAQDKALETERTKDGATETQAADHPTPRADSD
ncbi:MAG: hypothetical protein KJ731_03370 [Alphaproteobacteria bacterium]|nr:hypothetical protein [Alphaproteobacteria bacterium]MBU1280715.1 hypothetical protein [Alphaproteobacteria bacterium]MBU1572726.1 hypothetical protein [Alphaproteobacteria bacterium]MBU1827505.1 hypothetical protein [Alphaproteobacteria bacterium]MBU2077306.1 hypothetical protein [Alphaproteobacteria bacterium]